MKPLKHTGRLALVVTATTLLAACAGPGPKPDGELQATQNAIETAESRDAREHQPVLLKRAQDKVAEAESLMEEERYREAKRLLDEARVDAELAAARTETRQARRAADDINKSIEQMRERMGGQNQTTTGGQDD